MRRWILIKNRTMLKQKEIVAKIEEIQKITGIKVGSYTVNNEGAENLIIEVNKKWIFRFPKKPIFREKTEKRLNFLISFSKVSSLEIPTPKYIASNFIGYKKIPGKPLHPDDIEKLAKKDRLKIAKQFGLFLKALHNCRDKKNNFNTGYLVMRKKDYKSCPKQFVKYLSKKECEILGSRLRSIARNPMNFKKPTAIIHGDLYFNNILWNPNKKILTGILDWSELGLGIPAMDFIALADFNQNSNDQFLKDILFYYGAKNDDLFFQIKENAIIEVMNWLWFYVKTENLKGMARVVKKLKKILA